MRLKSQYHFGSEAYIHLKLTTFYCFDRIQEQGLYPVILRRFNYKFNFNLDSSKRNRSNI